MGGTPALRLKGRWRRVGRQGSSSKQSPALSGLHFTAWNAHTQYDLSDLMRALTSPLFSRSGVWQVRIGWQHR